ncbi:MAG: hypothetical protein JWQ43_3941 [Glaciihabitans sp.]|nr:hypothetical protein [Glaciihabitans sp.]
MVRSSASRRLWTIGASSVLAILIGVAAVGCSDAAVTAANTAAENTATENDLAGTGVTAVPSTSATAAPTKTTTPTPTKKAPVVEVREEIVSATVDFVAVNVDDASAEIGSNRISTVGVAGVRESTFQVTITDGVETARTMVGEVVTTAPVDQVTSIGTKPVAVAAPVAPPAATGSGCDPNYSGCVPVASDVDCAGGTGNGPAYLTGTANVTGSDPYDLDRDNNGIACD